MLIDAFIFNNELDLLELRLTELWDAVDKFVIVEMPIFHNGEPKRLNFYENQRRFERFEEKIWHHVALSYPVPMLKPTPLSLEHYQREQIRQFLIHPYISQDDVITISDCDEIPRPEVFLTAPKNGIATLNMRHSFWFMNCVAMSHAGNTAKLVTGAYLKDHPANEIRFNSDQIEVRQNAGWHMTWLGTSLDHVIKANTYSAYFEEHNLRLIEKLKLGLRPGLDSESLLFPNGMVKSVPIDSTFPKYVQENQDRLTKEGFILP